MDAESRESSHGYSISLEDLQVNRDTAYQEELLEMQCIVCRRTFTPWVEAYEGLDSSGLCMECKTLVVNDIETGSTARNPWGRQRRRTSRYGSSESLESVFSQMIGLARQNRDLQLEDDTTVAIHQRPNYTHRNRFRRVRRVNSDTDNDSIEPMDSLFGESDSHISFGGYGGDSDASLDGFSIIDREIPSPLDNESRIHTDTDIDPMHAGLDQWTSDEEASLVEASMQLLEPHGRGSATSPQNDAWIRWGPFTYIDEIDISPFTGNSGDYMDAQGFEELLEQLAEADSSRRGAPPAATSSVRSLPCVIISKDHEKNGTVVCAVCKDPLSINAEARQLPCSHLYHPSCIFPWLKTRNSCPICRYELPTDDPDYEEGKHNDVRTVIDEMRHHEPVDEIFSDESSDIGDEANDLLDGNDDVEGSSNNGGNVQWLLVVAAPIVTIVGVAIAAWIRNSMPMGRIHGGPRVHDTQQSHSSHGENRNRRWWFFFSGQD